MQKLFQMGSVSDHSFYKNDLHDSENNEGVINHLELDVLECKVKSLRLLHGLATNLATSLQTPQEA